MTTHQWADLIDLASDAYVRDGRWAWPWTNIGVFPVEGDLKDWWSRFLYTVGLSSDTEMWLACCSIEERCADFDLMGQVLNIVAAGWRQGLLESGDDVLMPIGIPNVDGEWDRDADAVLWIGEPGPRKRYQSNMSPAPDVIPVLWSSPLGWKTDA